MILLLWPEEQLPVIMRTPPNSNVTSTATCVVSFCCTTFLLLSSIEQHIKQCMMSLLTFISEATCSYISKGMQSIVVDAEQQIGAMSKRFCRTKSAAEKSSRARALP